MVLEYAKVEVPYVQISSPVMVTMDQGLSILSPANFNHVRVPRTYIERHMYNDPQGQSPVVVAYVTHKDLGTNQPPRQGTNVHFNHVHFSLPFITHTKFYMYAILSPCTTYPTRHPHY